MTKLILVRGAPGSGKSTFGRKLGAEIGAPVYESDEFFNDSEGVYRFDPSKLGYVHQMNRSRTEKTLSEGRTVIVCNTLTTLKEINEYLNIAKRLNIPVEVYRSNADFGNIHGVPLDKVAIMRGRMVDYPGEILVNS